MDANEIKIRPNFPDLSRCPLQATKFSEFLKPGKSLPSLATSTPPPLPMSTRAETRLSSIAFSRCQTFVESLKSDSLLDVQGR
jgi:hypothetical protein